MGDRPRASKFKPLKMSDVQGKPDPTHGYPKSDPDKKSANCAKNRHGMCYTLSCGCTCHNALRGEHGKEER